MGVSIRIALLCRVIPVHLRTTVPRSSLTCWPLNVLIIIFFLCWLTYGSFCYESSSWRGWEMRLYLAVTPCQRLFLVAVWFWVSQRSPYLLSLMLLRLFSAFFPPGPLCFFVLFGLVCFCFLFFLLFGISGFFFYSLKNVFKQINFLWYVTGQRYLSLLEIYSAWPNPRCLGRGNLAWGTALMSKQPIAFGGCFLDRRGKPLWMVLYQG